MNTPLGNEIDNLNRQITFLKKELQQSEDAENLYQQENIKLRDLNKELYEALKTTTSYAEELRHNIEGEGGLTEDKYIQDMSRANKAIAKYESGGK